MSVWKNNPGKLETRRANETPFRFDNIIGVYSKLELKWFMLARKIVYRLDLLFHCQSSAFKHVFEEI